jgi:hypothetical protein
VSFTSANVRWKRELDDVERPTLFGELTLESGDALLDLVPDVVGHLIEGSVIVQGDNLTVAHIR